MTGGVRDTLAAAVNETLPHAGFAGLDTQAVEAFLAALSSPEVVRVATEHVSLEQWSVLVSALRGER